MGSWRYSGRVAEGSKLVGIALISFATGVGAAAAVGVAVVASIPGVVAFVGVLGALACGVASIERLTR